MKTTNIPLFDIQTACLTKQAMFGYIDGLLSPAQCHQVEKHMLDCAFCSEAMEGLELVKDRTKVSGPVKAMPVPAENEQALEGGRMIRFNFNSRLAAAAVLILLVGSFVVLRYVAPEMTKKEVAQETGKRMLTPKTDGVNKPEPITSDDQTFYRHFEPFPARDPEPEALKDEEKPAPAYAWTMHEEQPSGGVSKEEVLKTEAPPPPPPNEVTLPVSSGQSYSKTVSTGDAVTSPAAPASTPLAALHSDVPSKNAVDHVSERKESDETVVSDDTGLYDKWEGKKAKEKDLQKTDDNASYKQEAPAKKMEHYAADAPASKDISGKDIASGEATDRKPDALQQKVTTTNESETRSGNMYLDKDEKYTTIRADSTRTVNTKSSLAGSAAAPAQPVAANGTGNGPAPDVKVADKSNSRHSPLDDAMDAYRSSDFATAAARFGKIISTEPSNVEALFYEGVSLLSLPQGDTKHAIQDFNKVIGAHTVSFDEAARWYKALALIKDSDTAGAKPILEDMSKGKGAYRAKAAKVMQDLDTQEKK